MKKIKYLIGCLVVCLGFAGFSFALVPVAELSSVENNSNYAIIFGNMYSFADTCSSPNGGCIGMAGFDNFGIYDGSTYDYFYSTTGVGQQYNQYSSDLTTFHGYDSQLHGGTHYGNYPVNFQCPTTSFSYSDFKFLIGNGTNFGSFYFSKTIPNDFSTTLCTLNGPIFNVGGLFNSNSNYFVVSYPSNSSRTLKYLRFFYTGTISGIDLINPANGTTPKFWAWESLTTTGVDTNFGSFTEATHDIYKYTHFGLYSMGYSFIYKSTNTDTGTISWDTLKFATVSDLIEIPLKLGDTSDLHGFAFGGILTVPEKSYHNTENLGQYLLAKDPTDPTRIMYEVYSCQNSYVPAVLNQSGGCVKLDGGYITQNGSTNVLPFSTFTNTFQISSQYLDAFPFLYLLSWSAHDIVSYSSTNGNSIILSNHGHDIVYGLQSDSSVDFRSMFESDLPVPTYSGSATIVDNCVNTEVCWYETGSNGEQIRMCTTRCVTSGAISSGSYIGADGTIYYVNSELNIDNLLNGDDSYLFDPTYLDSGGFLSTDFYSGLFDGTSSFKLGVCPYPESNLFSFATKLKIGNFYPFMPLNCFVSAFQQGAKIHYFDDFGLFPNLDSQLISGNTHFHRTLFRFFDLLLSLGMLLLLSFLHRLVKK